MVNTLLQPPLHTHIPALDPIPQVNGCLHNPGVTGGDQTPVVDHFPGWQGSSSGVGDPAGVEAAAAELPGEVVFAAEQVYGKSGVKDIQVPGV